MEGNEKIGAQVMREKFWNERDDDQKFAVLRSTLIQMCRLNEHLAQQVYKLMQHRHGADESLLAPLEDRNSLGNPLGYQRNHIPAGLRDKE